MSGWKILSGRVRSGKESSVEDGEGKEWMSGKFKGGGREGGKKGVGQSRKIRWKLLLKWQLAWPIMNICNERDDHTKSCEHVTHSRNLRPSLYKLGKQSKMLLLHFLIWTGELRESCTRLSCMISVCTLWLSCYRSVQSNRGVYRYFKGNKNLSQWFSFMSFVCLKLKDRWRGGKAVSFF